jgi:CrcB protein
VRNVLIIGAGSFLGGVFRFLLSRFIQFSVSTTFPLGTLGVNLLGCLVIGLVFGYSERWDLSQDWRLFLATGICGGFTTFSAFSNETFGMLRDGQFGFASAYVAASVVLGIFATMLGYSVIKTI